MKKEEKRVLTLDPGEHSVVVNALNQLRNGQIASDRCTDRVDDVRLKALDAPTKKQHRKQTNEAR